MNLGSVVTDPPHRACSRTPDHSQPQSCVLHMRQSPATGFLTSPSISCIYGPGLSLIVVQIRYGRKITQRGANGRARQEKLTTPRPGAPVALLIGCGKDEITTPLNGTRTASSNRTKESEKTRTRDSAHVAHMNESVLFFKKPRLLCSGQSARYVYFLDVLRNS